MSKLVSPFLEEVVHLVADFLESLDYSKEAKKIRKDFDLPEWIAKDNVLFKKGLKKVLKDYINNDEKTLKYFKERGPESQMSQQESEQPEVVVKMNNKKSPKVQSPKQSPINSAKSPKVKASTKKQENAWVTSRFSQPKRLQDINQEGDKPQIKQQPVKTQVKPKKSKKVKQPSSQEESSEDPKPKKQKKKIKKQKKVKKVKGPVDTSYLNSDDDFELETKQKQTNKKVKVVEKVQTKVPLNLPTRKQSKQIQQIEEQAKVYNNPYNRNGNQNVDGYKKFFSRINPEQIGFIPENLRDNSFQAKSRYGAAAGDQWGRFGHQKLKDTRGQSFKKTKGKLKNRAFQGSGINIDKINSVPL